MNSLWSETVKPTGFPPLKGDTKTEVLIIGGGMAGILCAYFLQKAGVDYILTEANIIGDGITKNTTAKITSQHGLLYHKLLKNAGIEKTKMYLNANQSALDEYRRLCDGIDCDFEEKDAYVYSVSDRKIIENELSALDKIGFNAEFADKIPMIPEIAGAVKFPKQAQFHLLKFIVGISKGLSIYENTRITELAPHTAMKPQLLLNGFTAVGNLLTPTVPRCPHMGCALKWNRAERSWDCPCHGSRFEDNGKIIDNPATGGLKR